MDTDSVLLGALRAMGRAVLWVLDAFLTVWPWDPPGDDSYRARRRRRIWAALVLVSIVLVLAAAVLAPGLG